MTLQEKVYIRSVHPEVSQIAIHSLPIVGTMKVIIVFISS
jgi:hypothetical protein